MLFLAYAFLMMALFFKIMPETFQVTSTLWARIPVFMLGVIAAVKMDGRRSSSKKILPTCIFVNMIFLLVQGYFALQGSEQYYSYFPRLCYGPLAITFIVMAVSCFETQKFKVVQKIFAFLGEMTLEIYLLNSKLIGGFSRFVTKINNGRLVLLANVLAVVTTITLAFYMHKIIKKINLNCLEKSNLRWVKDVKRLKKNSRGHPFP